MGLICPRDWILLPGLHVEASFVSNNDGGPIKLVGSYLWIAVNIRSTYILLDIFKAIDLIFSKKCRSISLPNNLRPIIYISTSIIHRPRGEGLEPRFQLCMKGAEPMQGLVYSPKVELPDGLFAFFLFIYIDRHPPICLVLLILGLPCSNKL